MWRSSSLFHWYFSRLWPKDLVRWVVRALFLFLSHTCTSMSPATHPSSTDGNANKGRTASLHVERFYSSATMWRVTYKRNSPPYRLARQYTVDYRHTKAATTVYVSNTLCVYILYSTDYYTRRIIQLSLFCVRWGATWGSLGIDPRNWTPCVRTWKPHGTVLYTLQRLYIHSLQHCSL